MEYGGTVCFCVVTGGCKESRELERPRSKNRARESFLCKKSRYPAQCTSLQQVDREFVISYVIAYFIIIHLEKLFSFQF
jgi:hypothetical protein